MLFASLWWSCLILYPQWYVRGTNIDRLAILGLTWLGVFAGTILVVWLFRGVKDPLIKEPDSLYRAISELWPVLTLCLFAHLPFLTAPVVTGLDAQEHAGVPAVLVAWVGDRLPIPLPLIGWLSLIAFAVLFCKVCRTPVQTRALIGMLVLLLLVGGLLTVFLLRTNVIERMGADPRFLSRYPALGRFLYIGMYTLFGIHEWAGRMSQLLLSAFAAVYAYRIGLLFMSQTVAIAGATLLLFLAPMFHYGNLNMLDCGTVALSVTSEFYLLRYLEESRRRDFYWALFLLTAGILYKQVLILMVPVAFVQWFVQRLCLLLQKRGNPIDALLDAMGFLLPAGTVVLGLCFSWLNPEVPVHYSGYRTHPVYHLLDAAYLFAPLTSLPMALTSPALIMVPLGMLISLNRGPASRRWFWYGISWYAVYAVCYVPWETPENIRQALPSYPPLLLFAATTFDWLVSDATQLARKFMWGFLFAHLLWVVLLLPRESPAPDHRPIKDYTWMNLTNRSAFFLPYPDMFRRMEETVPPGAVVYAPMANEPSRFYLAAYAVEARWTYLGDPWAAVSDQTVESLRLYCQSKGVSYLLLPNRRWAQMALSQRLLEAITNGEAQWLQPAAEAIRGTERLTLYRLAQ
jgi:hypothetical protein